MQQKERITSLLNKWKPILGLDDWIITFNLINKHHEDKDGREADINAIQRYRNADLNIYKDFWDEAPDHQEKNIVHELVHLLLWRLDPFIAPAGADSLEEVVQTIAMQFYACKVK